MQHKVLVGTTDGLYEVSDNAETLISGHEVTCLARGASGWWAIVDGRELWTSDGNGVWGGVAALETLRANCVLEAESRVLVGTSEAHLFALQGDALEPVAAFDRAPERESWYTPWGGPPDIRSMSATPSGAVYANVHVGGVVRSVDVKTSWEPTIDIHSDVHQVVCEPNEGVVLAASGRGLAVSEDDGKSWRFETGDLHGTYLRAVAVAGETVIVSASTGPFSKRAAVYRKPLGKDEPFQRCSDGLPEWFSDNIDTHCLAAKGQHVAFGTSEGSVFLSADEGRTWTEARRDLPPVRCAAIE